MMSSGSQTPGISMTAAIEASSGGRVVSVGRSVGVSPGVGSRTHASTPSSWATTGFQPACPAAPRAMPCHRQTTSPRMTSQSSSRAPRWGQVPGPAINVPDSSRQSTISRPAMVRVTERFVPTSPLRPTTYQPPGSCDCATSNDARIRPGRACFHVLRRCSCGTVGTFWIGMRRLRISARNLLDAVTRYPSVRRGGPAARIRADVVALLHDATRARPVNTS